MYVSITSHKQKNTWAKWIFIYHIEKTIKGLQFLTEDRDTVVAQTKGRGPLVSQAKGETAGHSSEGGNPASLSKERGESCWSLKQTCHLPVCVLRPSHYFTKRVPATEERYARSLSDCIPIHTIVAVKE